MSAAALPCGHAHAKSDSLERPLHSLPKHRNDVHALAVALLHAEPTFEAHLTVLQTMLPDKFARRRHRALAIRSVRWTAKRPQPRLNNLVHLLRADKLFQQVLLRPAIHLPLLPAPPPRMRPLPTAPDLPPLETTEDLAQWLRLDHEHLLWFADLRDLNHTSPPQRSHYHLRLIPKPNRAGVRVLEAPKARLRSIQQQILHELLDLVPLHDAVHGFRRGRSIATFAAPHTGKDAVLRLDLENFFPSLSGPRIQALFRTLGYPESVADLLGGLCTATIPKRLWTRLKDILGPDETLALRELYARPHLPQGAPTSPALANLCAFRLDRRLSALAHAAGAAYTRYADDLAFSGDGNFARFAERFAIRVAAIALEEGFHVNHHKTRLMRASVRQHLAGLTVNTAVNLSRKDLKQLEAILHNCVHRGPATQNRAEHSDFRRYLEGRVAFATMINPTKAHALQALLARINWEA